MYRRVLVPLDGTSFGDHALPYAIRIAARTGAALELVHVHKHYEVDAGLYAMPQYHFEHVQEAGFRRDRQALELERERLEQRAADIETRFGVRTSGRLLRGSTAQALWREANDFMADLVVMATHARKGVARIVRGDLPHQFIHEFNIPALVVHPLTEDAPVGTGEVKHVVIAVDGSPFSEQILEVAGPLARALDARVSLLHAYSGRTLATNGLHAEERPIAHRAEAVEYLDRVAARLPHDVRDLEFMIVESDDPAGVIADAVKDEAGALLAMATHGRSGVSRLVMGSVADQVVHATHQPVLLYRPILAPVAETGLASVAGIEAD
jgi:nucleotide-binding universal stress UspA family protein